MVRAALFDGQMCFSVFRLVTRVVHEHMRTKQQSMPPLSSFQNVSGWCMAREVGGFLCFLSPVGRFVHMFDWCEDVVGFREAVSGE